MLAVNIFWSRCRSLHHEFLSSSSSSSSRPDSSPVVFMLRYALGTGAARARVFSFFQESKCERSGECGEMLLPNDTCCNGCVVMALTSPCIALPLVIVDTTAAPAVKSFCESNY